MSILFNQIAIRFFNHLMSHTEYVPIVNTKGDVIGKTPAVEAINYKNAYINPVIRIAISTHGMLFLCDRLRQLFWIRIRQIFLWNVTCVSANPCPTVLIVY